MSPMPANDQPSFPGLEYDFLRYMGVSSENQRRIQSHYLSYFEHCQQVVDLACGDADFIELLLEREIDVIGIDSDEKAYAEAATKGLPVIKEDVFRWLAAQPNASLDGVFSAHLIEHLPYPKVIELIQQSYRILRAGGVILLVTPNVRSLFSHLEMFYTHFGHVTFYHPRQVCFFLDWVGFENVQFGENPETASPLLAGLHSSLVVSQPSATAWLSYQPEVPLQGRTPFHYLSYWTKRLLTRWLVRPLTDSLQQQFNILAQQQRQFDMFAQQWQQIFGAEVQTLNGPFETYIWAYKPNVIKEPDEE